MPGLVAPSISTGVPSGWEPESQPFVSVASPVLEQCAAWPMYVLAPSWKTKLEVHWPPDVTVWLPGRIAALSAESRAWA